MYFTCDKTRVCWIIYYVPSCKSIAEIFTPWVFDFSEINCHHFNFYVLSSKWMYALVILFPQLTFLTEGKVCENKLYIHFNWICRILKNIIYSSYTVHLSSLFIWNKKVFLKLIFFRSSSFFPGEMAFCIIHYNSIFCAGGIKDSEFNSSYYDGTASEIFIPWAIWIPRKIEILFRAN